MKTVYTFDKRPRKTTMKKSSSSISPVRSATPTRQNAAWQCISDKQTFLRDEEEKNEFSEDSEKYCCAYTCMYLGVCRTGEIAKRVMNISKNANETREKTRLSGSGRTTEDLYSPKKTIKF